MAASPIWSMDISFFVASFVWEDLVWKYAIYRDATYPLQWPTDCQRHIAVQSHNGVAPLRRPSFIVALFHIQLILSLSFFQILRQHSFFGAGFSNKVYKSINVKRKMVLIALRTHRKVLKMLLPVAIFFAISFMWVGAGRAGIMLRYPPASA